MPTTSATLFSSLVLVLGSLLQGGFLKKTPFLQTQKPARTCATFHGNSVRLFFATWCVRGRWDLVHRQTTGQLASNKRETTHAAEDLSARAATRSVLSVQRGRINGRRGERSEARRAGAIIQMKAPRRCAPFIEFAVFLYCNLICRGNNRANVLVD